MSEGQSHRGGEGRMEWAEKYQGEGGKVGFMWIFVQGPTAVGTGLSI